MARAGDRLARAAERQAKWQGRLAFLDLLSFWLAMVPVLIVMALCCGGVVYIALH